jgi:hypothetical protein
MTTIFTCDCGYKLEINNYDRRVKALKERLVQMQLFGCKECVKRAKELIKEAEHV